MKTLSLLGLLSLSIISSSTLYAQEKKIEKPKKTGVAAGDVGDAETERLKADGLKKTGVVAGATAAAGVGYAVSEQICN